jgi:Family of unknown function (DUF5906)
MHEWLTQLFLGHYMDYRAIPALATYIDRIGATELNFRKFMVKEYRGNYYVERAFIEIVQEGTERIIKCNDDRYAPTEAETEAIKIALRGVEWPTYIEAAAAKLRSLRTMLAEREGCAQENLIIYEFYNRMRDTLIMCQQRKEIDGRKKYIPWTYWSDNLWRSMEPDCALPFWKPRTSTDKVRIMVHEGAKAAHHVNGLINAPEMAEHGARHPWIDELRDFEHWGMIGGALAPQRTDWKVLRDAKPREVVYVCDNDFAGRSALQQVSSAFRYPMKGVMFDQRWEQSWDMGDPMPAKLYNGNRWLGPSLRSLMRPATWATERATLPEGKKVIRLRRDFAEEWFHCVRPEVFIHRDWPADVWTAQEFNTHMRPFCDVDDLAKVLKTDATSKTAHLKYTPELRPGIYNSQDQRYINTYKPSEIKAEAGDPSPWLEFMAHLVENNEDRTELLRWCATLIARPDVKMLYGVLLISEVQGVGKGTLGERILAPLIGERNVSFPNEAEIVDSNYNYWASHKRLAIVHEIYAGHSAKAYNKLKSIITDHHITVSQKYLAHYLIENWIHVFACSNSVRALKLSMDDRRWFVPKITDNKRDAAYWDAFYKWLRFEGGLSIIKWWADMWLTQNACVVDGSPAPWSLRKKEVIEDSYSPGQQFVADALNELKRRMHDTPIFLTDFVLREAIKIELYNRRPTEFLESLQTIRKVAKHMGWYVGAEYVYLSGLGLNCARAKIIASTPELARITTAEEFEANRQYYLPLLEFLRNRQAQTVM